jgi:hypothetical protein
VTAREESADRRSQNRLHLSVFALSTPSRAAAPSVCKLAVLVPVGFQYAMLCFSSRSIGGSIGRSDAGGLSVRKALFFRSTRGFGSHQWWTPAKIKRKIIKNIEKLSISPIKGKLEPFT